MVIRVPTAGFRRTTYSDVPRSRGPFFFKSSSRHRESPAFVVPRGRRVLRFVGDSDRRFASEYVVRLASAVVYSDPVSDAARLSHIVIRAPTAGFRRTTYSDVPHSLAPHFFKMVCPAKTRADERALRDTGHHRLS